MKNFLYMLGSTVLLLLSMTDSASSACIDPAKLRGLVIAPVTDYDAGELLANFCPVGRVSRLLLVCWMYGVY